MLNIGYDREESTEWEPKYFVYEHTFGGDGSYENVVIYKGTYAQCLVIVGAGQIDPDMTLEEIRDKTNGFI